MQALQTRMTLLPGKRVLQYDEKIDFFYHINHHTMETQAAAITTSLTPVLAKGTTILLSLILIRDAVRKGIALRKAGTKRQLVRFICIFIFNTLGILPIIYLIFFQKKERVATVKSSPMTEKVQPKIVKAIAKKTTKRK